MKGKISERKVIIFTAALVVFAGLVKLLSYIFGIVLFYLAFLPYIIYRSKYYYARKGTELTQPDRYRFVVLVAMVLTIFLNIVGIQDVEFFLLFLIMIDFLLVLNNKL